MKDFWSKVGAGVVGAVLTALVFALVGWAGKGGVASIIGAVPQEDSQIHVAGKCFKPARIYWCEADPLQGKDNINRVYISLGVNCDKIPGWTRPERNTEILVSCETEVPN